MLIWGLCYSDTNFRFDVNIFCVAAFLDSEEKKIHGYRKNTNSPRLDPASQHICTHVYFAHIYECMYAETYSIRTLRALQVSRLKPWAHN